MGGLHAPLSPPHLYMPRWPPATSPSPHPVHSLHCLMRAGQVQPDMLGVRVGVRPQVKRMTLVVCGGRGSR